VGAPADSWQKRVVSAAHTLVVFVTAPAADAPALARALVERRLAACVNLVGGVRSVYRWQGQVEDDAESLLMIKTTHDGFAALEAAVVELHPYTCPEVLALPVDRGYAPYLRWLADEVG
jgi:periplasmic divalent cation tolerance protein